MHLIAVLLGLELGSGESAGLHSLLQAPSQRLYGLPSLLLSVNHFIHISLWTGFLCSSLHPYQPLMASLKWYSLFWAFNLVSNSLVSQFLNILVPKIPEEVIWLVHIWTVVQSWPNQLRMMVLPLPGVEQSEFSKRCDWRGNVWHHQYVGLSTNSLKRWRANKITNREEKTVFLAHFHLAHVAILMQELRNWRTMPCSAAFLVLEHYIYGGL